MTPAYNKLITKTFCDNAIRTVMMIDDDYVPYNKLVDLANKSEDINTLQRSLLSSQTASEIQSFFERKKFICDVSDGDEGFDTEKARKSDLLILDYQLENDNPTRSLNILSKLSKTPHMNLVILYTRETLSKVWLEIAASVTGFKRFETEEHFEDESFLELWESETNDGDSLPESWDDFSPNDLAQFLKNKKINPSHLSKKLGVEHRKYTKNIYCASAALKLAEFDKLDQTFERVEIEGSFNDIMWLKFGNVFIALHSKTDEDDSEALWNTLTNSLIDWQPNYYRLITSEIQNQIENSGLTVNKFLVNDYHSQSALLWQILGGFEDSEKHLKIMLENNADAFKDKIVFHPEILQFASEVCSILFDKYPNEESTTELDKVKFTSSHTSRELNLNDQGLANKVVHSLNKLLSTKIFVNDFITTGTILHCEDDDDWLLCVTPACDTVPEQNNSCMSKRLQPNFKFLKFIKLNRINQSKALSKATDGFYLFIDGGTTLQTNQNPNIEYAICQNNKLDKDQFQLFLLGTNEEVVDDKEAQITFSSMKNIYHVKGQLKDGYAARFQALASHHSGRVGVDFIKFGTLGE